MASFFIKFTFNHWFHDISTNTHSLCLIFADFFGKACTNNNWNIGPYVYEYFDACKEQSNHYRQIYHKKGQ